MVQDQCAKPEKLFICFADPLAMLNMAHDWGNSKNRDDISFESDIQKAGCTKGSLVTLARLSFNRELPLVFGHDSLMTGIDDVRALSDLKS